MSHLGQPGQIGTIVKSVRGRDVTNDRLNELERVVKQLTVARSGDYTTIGNGGTLHVDGLLAIAGALQVMGVTTLDGALTLVGGATITASGDIQSANYVAGVSGWKLDGTTGDLEINQLTIRDGIVGDAALTDPVSGGAFTGSAVLSQTFTTSYATYITESITVPAGFSTAFVYATTVATGIASGGLGTDAYISARTRINGVDGPEVDSVSRSGVIATSPYSVELTGLTGGSSIQILARVKDGLGGGSLLASVGGCTLYGFAFFLR